MTDRELLELLLQKVGNIEDRVVNTEQKIVLMKSQLDENTLIIKALMHGQEEIKAQLDSIGMDVHKLNGEITGIKEQHDERVDQLETDVKLIKRILTNQ